MRRWIAGLGGLFAGTALALLLLDGLFPLPLQRAVEVGSEIRDPDGRLIHTIPAKGGTWRFAATAAEISPSYLALLVAVEDRRFWWHPGVDPLALGRAAMQRILNGRVVSGGSTISMQVARLLEPKPRTLRSKTIEILRALQLEARLGKSGVLGLYLTLAPMGGNLEGVKAGARGWFGREAVGLDPHEAALLVALPQLPSKLRPDRNAAAARRARDRVLQVGREVGLFDPSELRLASGNPVPLERLELPRALPRFAVARSIAGQTTIRASIQEAAQSIAGDAARAAGPDACAALVIARTRTRTVDAAAQACAEAGPVPDLLGALRSPGSTLKPFLYALAFDAGVAAPLTRLQDRPRRFGSFSPENFSGGFLGEVTAADALRLSLNVPAVGLLDQLGPGVFLAALRSTGILVALPDGAAPSLPLALGGVGIRIADLVALYAALPEAGMAAPLRWAGSEQAATVPFIGSEAAALVVRILAESPPPPGGSRVQRHGIAWKTGTSWGNRDAWAAGANQTHAAAVWIGRSDGTPMPGLLGRGAAGPTLFRLFALLPQAPFDTRSLPPLATGPDTGGRAASRETLRLAFPPEGAELDALGGIMLRAEGGRRPLSWLVDGRLIDAAPYRRDAMWRPEGPGFYRLSVLDAHGASAAVIVRVR